MKLSFSTIHVITFIQVLALVFLVTGCSQQPSMNGAGPSSDSSEPREVVGEISDCFAGKEVITLKNVDVYALPLMGHPELQKAVMEFRSRKRYENPAALQEMFRNRNRIVRLIRTYADNAIKTRTDERGIFLLRGLRDDIQYMVLAVVPPQEDSEEYFLDAATVKLRGRERLDIWESDIPRSQCRPLAGGGDAEASTGEPLSLNIKKWHVSSFKRLTLGKSNKSDVLRVMGTAVWSGEPETPLYESSKDEVWYSYLSLAPKGRITMVLSSKNDRLIGILIQPDDLSWKQANAQYGPSYVVKTLSPCEPEKKKRKKIGALYHPLFYVYPTKGMHIYVTETRMVSEITYLLRCSY